MKQGDFELTSENYHSLEANKIWCSKSQFADFFGMDGCEARAVARINGEFEEPKSEAFTLGSYVDCILTEPDKVDAFIEEHPEIISSRGATKGLLKAEYQRANVMVDRVKKDKKMMSALSGEHQKIMKGTIFGLPFKIKMDSYIEHKAIVDLKTVESLYKGYYIPNRGRVTFVEYFDYILQGAIYQEIVYQNTGERLPFYLACVSKEPIPDIALVGIDNKTLHDRIFGNELSEGIARECEQIMLLKRGEVKPIRCEHCAYCLPTKKITKPIHYLDLLGKVEED